jgi:hypothetical protein
LFLFLFLFLFLCVVVLLICFCLFLKSYFIFCYPPQSMPFTRNRTQSIIYIQNINQN